jgi:hypothetical protein
MRKSALIAFTLILFAAFSSPAFAGVPDTAANQKMVDDFAPWISAIIQQKWAVADRIFPLEKAAQAEAEAAQISEIYSRFTKLDDTPISLVGVHILGDQIGTAFFTTVTEHGPIAFKISYYRYGTDIHVGKIEFATHWSEIEALSLTVDPLPAPVTAPLRSRQ